MRADRILPEPDSASRLRDADSPFRQDLERIRFSSYYARLSAVTQVIGQTGAGPLVHNRLTHSLKVTAVARAIAADVAGLIASRDLPDEYVCDPVVAQAAASAHDLGHPPFGHLGESVLDRLARESLGLLDGFEGNAQTYRIIAMLDVCHGPSHGLNLTAATRSAVAKYPWTPGVELSEPVAATLPPGLRWVNGRLSVRKYSAYFLDAEDLSHARERAHGLLPLQQSLEGSVMDIADDIAYSVHDVDDFHRAGLLGQGAVSREFRGWIDGASSLAAIDDAELTTATGRPGVALELLRRKQLRDDPWIADAEAFRAAVHAVASDLVDGLLAESYDGSLASERALASFTSRWIHHFQRSVVLAPTDNPARAWSCWTAGRGTRSRF
ncbi:dGTP triphosphohydrolase [Microbacterium sp. NIBRBAC000506063]|uniref:dGTP triphosphohydrolase n=1 Tax=Microbacterium sp. NIBRBAC000506063 TaxID=2734618 RepID=UPI001BB7FD17|nr:dNTP triphosphohydrolase [Microbacterium sp. NIBRBAC000506063]QTV80757.1 dNTP triphosphohydrolase [Microbacterium sp. NIBRBAC000506063]